MPVVQTAASPGRAGNHVDVTSRWLGQRRCHIDVVERGGCRAPGLLSHLWLVLLALSIGLTWGVN